MNKETDKIYIPVTGPEQEKETGSQASSAHIGSDENSEDYKDRLVRLQAEFSNYKKRVDKEQQEFHTYYKAELVRKLLPVIDDLERMIHYTGPGNHADASPAAMELIAKNMMKILTDEGLEEIHAKGQGFNPEIHEAVGVEETDEAGDNRVLEVWQKGYTFNGRMIRPSRVKVGRFQPAAGKEM